MPLLTTGDRLQEVPAMIFDWEHFVLFDRLACVAYSLEDGCLQGVTAHSVSAVHVLWVHVRCLPSLCSSAPPGPVYYLAPV